MFRWPFLSRTSHRPSRKSEIASLKGGLARKRWGHLPPPPQFLRNEREHAPKRTDEILAFFREQPNPINESPASRGYTLPRSRAR